MTDKITILQLRKKEVYAGGDSSDSDADDLGLSNLRLEKKNLVRKKKLLVLSINGLLLHRVFALKDATFVPGCRPPDGRFGKHFFFKRPFVEQFLEFCFERFEIGIWSTAMAFNVNGVLDCAMPGLKDKLMFVWGQKECTDSGFRSIEKKDKPIFLKELKKLWENADRQFLWQKGKYCASNTLMIDDNPCKALLNPPNTSIFPESYNAVNEVNTVLDPKRELGQFLDGLADAEDVQTYVKQHPFGQPAITNSHPRWDYYSMVIRSLRRD